MGYDVVIVGASVAGCSAAIHYGRAGLRVAVLERARDAAAYKALCGHFILGGAGPALERLGLWDRLLAEGAATAVPSMWTGEGWVVPGPGVPRAISIRRKVLDPLLRDVAASTPGVELHLGHVVRQLVTERGGVRGVVAETADGERRHFEGTLVVGADGHRSPVGTLAGARTSTVENARFLYWAYYRDVELRSPGDAAVWFVDPDVAVAVPADDGLTLVGAFPTKARLAEFEADRLGALERLVAGLPDAPALGGAGPVSRVIGTSDHPMVRRDPVPRPGLALIGDAATSSDPVPAVGCGWALRSAEWLADATIPALQGRGSIAAGLRTYRRARRFLDGHDRLLRADARGREPNPMQLALRRAALLDEETARRFGRFAMRADPVSGLLNPRTLGRAAWIAHRHRSQPVAAPVASAP